MPAPDLDPAFVSMPTYKPAQTFGEYLNAPLESGGTHAQQLFDIGSLMRDDHQQRPTPPAFNGLTPQQSDARHGGGVGGAGPVYRKNRRGVP